MYIAFVWEWYLAPYINMHPHCVTMTDVCNGTERIKGSIHCGTCCGIHIEWNQTLRERQIYTLY